MHGYCDEIKKIKFPYVSRKFRKCYKSISDFDVMCYNKNLNCILLLM